MFGRRIIAFDPLPSGQGEGDDRVVAGLTTLRTFDRIIVERKNMEDCPAWVIPPHVR